MELRDLVGLSKLSGVDFFEEVVKDRHYGDYTDCCVCLFNLNGITYKAIEDPDDGYRGMLKEVSILKDYKLKNTFQPVDVVCEIQKDEYNNKLIKFYDILTYKLVLEVGTVGYDDGYPMFVASFHPENMIINAGVKNEYI